MMSTSSDQDALPKRPGCSHAAQPRMIEVEKAPEAAAAHTSKAEDLAAEVQRLRSENQELQNTLRASLQHAGTTTLGISHAAGGGGGGVIVGGGCGIGPPRLGQQTSEEEVAITIAPSESSPSHGTALGTALDTALGGGA